MTASKELIQASRHLGEHLLGISDKSEFIITLLQFVVEFSNCDYAAWNLVSTKPLTYVTKDKKTDRDVKVRRKTKELGVEVPEAYVFPERDKDYSYLRPSLEVTLHSSPIFEKLHKQNFPIAKTKDSSDSDDTDLLANTPIQETVFNDIGCKSQLAVIFLKIPASIFRTHQWMIVLTINWRDIRVFGREHIYESNDVIAEILKVGKDFSGKQRFNKFLEPYHHPDSFSVLSHGKKIFVEVEFPSMKFKSILNQSQIEFFERQYRFEFQNERLELPKSLSDKIIKAEKQTLEASITNGFLYFEKPVSIDAKYSYLSDFRVYDFSTNTLMIFAWIHYKRRQIALGFHEIGYTELPKEILDLTKRQFEVFAFLTSEFEFKHIVEILQLTSVKSLKYHTRKIYKALGLGDSKSRDKRRKLYTYNKHPKVQSTIEDVIKKQKS